MSLDSHLTDFANAPIFEAVAGIAASVRQYFMEGYYSPSSTGVKNSASGFTPSGALVKAMILAAAVPVHYVYYTGSYIGTGTLTSLTTYPSNYQGFGRVQINRVLHFGPASTSPLTLSVIGDVSSTSSLYHAFTAASQSYQTTFAVTSNTTVRVVMAYSDYSSGTPTSPIMQNILSLSVNDGTTTFNPYTSSVSNTYYVMDIAATPGKTYTVTVQCTSFSSGPQPFALVMVGRITQLTAASPVETLIDSQLKLSSIPYIDGIIVMAIVAFCLVSITVGVCVAETLAERKIFFKMQRW